MVSVWLGLHGLILVHVRPSLRRLTTGCTSGSLTARTNRALQQVDSRGGLQIKGLFFCSMAQVYPEDCSTNYVIRKERRVARLIAESCLHRRTDEPCRNGFNLMIA